MIGALEFATFIYFNTFSSDAEPLEQVQAQRKRKVRKRVDWK